MTASDYKGSEINISDSNDGREGYLEVDKTAGESFISYQDVDTAQKMKFSIKGTLMQILKFPCMFLFT